MADDADATAAELPELDAVDIPDTADTAAAAAVPDASGAPAAAAATTASAMPDFVCGIDLGADSSIVARLSTRSLKSELLRNDMSNQATPMCISFAGAARSFGEVAVQMLTTNKDSSVENLLRLLDLAHASNAPDAQLADAPVADSSVAPLVGSFTDDGARLRVHAAGEERLLRPEQLVGMMLRKLASFRSVEEQAEAQEGQTASDDAADAAAADAAHARAPLAVVVPDSFSAAHVQAVRDAARIAGVDLRAVVTRTEAAVTEYAAKRSAEALGDGAVVCFADVGHSYASAAAVRFEGKRARVLASACARDLGGEAVDALLFDALSADCERQRGVRVSRGSKAGVRLMVQVRKLKEALSAVPQANVVCESLVDEHDVKFSMTREQLEAACAPVRAALVRMLTDQVLGKLADEDRARIRVCELIGGGMRVPFVKEAVSEALGGDVSLSFTMDSMAAVVVGAALCCVKAVMPEGGLPGGIVRPALENLPEVSFAQQQQQQDQDQDQNPQGTQEQARASGAPLALMTEAEVAAAVQLEAALLAADRETARLHAARNRLEARIFEARALAQDGSRQPHSHLVDRAAASAAADAMEQWLWDAPDDAPLSALREKLVELEAQLAPALAAYNAAVAEERARKDQEMEADMERARADEEAAGGKDDHDFRRLKKPERMRKVQLNKDEGTTLFTDGNFEAASLRYIRALQHADKFFDLSPEDEKEVTALKLSLHLNCAQCYLKLERWPDAAKSSEAALAQDADSVKALFRLAYAKENLRQFDEAKALLARAATLAPEDKAVQKLMERVLAQLRREEAKRKKMAQRMFS